MLSIKKQKHAIVYYYWSNECNKINENTSTPIILSIATLRKYNKSIKIYVLDCDEKTNWIDFEKKYNFKVIRCEPIIFSWGIDKRITKFPYDKKDISADDHLISILASRHLDIFKFSANIEEEIIIHCDCDVFWLDNVLSLNKSGSKFTSFGNTGLFYFNKNSHQVSNYFDKYKETIDLALSDFEYFTKIKEFHPCKNYRKMISDELVNYYLSSSTNLVEELDESEHLTPSRLKKANAKIKYKMFHAVGLNKTSFIFDLYETNELAKEIYCMNKNPKWNMKDVISKKSEIFNT